MLGVGEALRTSVEETQFAHLYQTGSEIGNFTTPKPKALNPSWKGQQALAYQHLNTGNL